jgi:hypothetical protein
MDLKAYYKDVMSKRDYDYYDTYNAPDQQAVIEETRRRLHESNVRKLKECVTGNRFMTLMGLASHVSNWYYQLETSRCRLIELDLTSRL